MTEETGSVPPDAPNDSFQRRLAGLRRRSALKALARALARRGLSAWIVGGSVRDLWLGRPLLDVDVAVAGDPDGLARELERDGVGRRVALSETRPRVYRLAGRGTELDLAELERGSIEADLGRRDFTVNAVALPLPRGEPIDPCGGLVDLARGRLSAVADENFEDDPLRALRAARFMATLGLEPDRATDRLCRRTAPRLASVAPERIQVELAKLLEAPEAARAFSWAARRGLLAAAFAEPSAAAASRLAQAARARTFDAPAVVRLPPAGRRRARLAQVALRLGWAAPEAARRLASGRWSREESGAVARLVDRAREAGRLTEPDAAWRWIRDAGRDAPEALALIEATGPAGKRRATGLRRRLARARRGPRVGGGDVLRWLGIAPGPSVGKLLAALEIERLSGRVRTRREARKWLVSRAPAIIRTA